MKTIVMDSANKYLVVALYENQKCLASLQEEGNRKQSEYAIVYLQKLLQENHLKMSDFDEMVITIGPGSYTGVRVALTIAKTLNATMNIKVKTVSSLKAMAGMKKAISILDARSHKLFLGIYNEGKVIVDANGKPVKNKSIDVDMLPYRKKMQMVFQDPYSSLNPRKHIYEILSQPMLYHGISNKETVHRDVDRLLDMVGLPKHVLGRYPHEFSGGQRQRIGIARALSLNPRFLVCDEPVSALDVSIQAQILNLLRSLQKDLGLTCMFVGHGLGAVNYVSDRIAVMYLGKIVEIGPAQEVFHHPVHPYTRALIDAVPIADPKKREQKPLLTGEIGSSTNPPSGCRFHPRCPYATESCRQEVPELCSVFPGSSHLAACPYAVAQLTGGAPAYDAKMQQVVVEQKWR